MRVLFRIAVGMVHTVHNSVRTGIQKGGSLEKPCTEVKEFLPEGVGIEHLMGGVSV